MVIAAQCRFVSGAEQKQKHVKQGNKAVVLLLSLSLAEEAEVPSHQEEGGFAPASPAIHSLLGQMETG